MSKADNRPDMNEEERRKILDDIKIGIWRIEYIAQEPPRMYGDANMYEIMGAELHLQPEQLYQHWHERIEPAYLSYIDKEIAQLITTGQPAEVEYIWNHPQSGKTVIRCEATISSSSKDGQIVMLGMHRDIGNRLMKNNWEEMGYQVTDHYKMACCGRYLIGAYEDIFLVDMKTKGFCPVACRRGHCHAFKESGTISEVISRCVFEEDREQIANLFSDESIQKIVREKGTASADFRKGANCGVFRWVRGTIYLIQINGNDEILFVTQDVQNEYDLKIMKDEKEDVLCAIVHDQSVIYEYDIESQRLQILKHDARDVSRSSDVAKLSVPKLAEKLCTHYVDTSEWTKVKLFLSYETIQNVVESASKEFIVSSLDVSCFKFDFVKISVLPSLQSKDKVYIMLETINQKERLYPLLEAYLRDTVDSIYCIDLKTGCFFRVIDNGKDSAMLPVEGDNYEQVLHEYVERYVVEKEKELVMRQMSPKMIYQSLENTAEFTCIESIIGEDGEIRKKRLTFRSLDLSKGHVMLQRSDVTDLYHKDQVLKKVQKDSMTDSLTQLYNRFGSERMIRQALAEADETKRAVMILLDLDNFKEVNDQFGHPEGDRVLYEVGRKLKECFRAEDIIGRLGGDEYIVFLPNGVREAGLHSVLRRVVQKLSITCENETESVTVTASAGATFYRGQLYEEMYKEADIALYHAKEKKNSYSLFGDIQQ